ncbi:MAG: aldo/keto reductase [Candidatus Dadabacteria bacterium]|nr:MAG: aldo/keto reductase [Candidatus Dadabacteria bacterium]
MDKITLGKTSIAIPPLCVGTWQASGWSKSDSKMLISIIHTALDSGINFVDTAEAYGDGYSEETVAKAIKGIRREVIIATKVFYTNAEPSRLRKSLEGSLRRLQTDYIDLYQYHWPSPSVPLDDTVGEMCRLKEEGKILAVGVSNWMEPEWEETTKADSIDSLQACYSLLWRNGEKSVFPMCAERKITILAYSPLCQGILANRFSSLKEVPNDPRKRNVFLQEERFEETLSFCRELKAIADQYGKSPAQAALNWLLCRDFPVVPIVGCTSIEQLKDNLGALDWELEKKDLDRLSELSEKFSIGLKPHDSLWNWHPRENASSRSLSR